MRTPIAVFAGILTAAIVAAAQGQAMPPSAESFDEIDTANGGTFGAGLWKYELKITGKGTRSQGSQGRLFYNGVEVPDAKGINDRYNTPWGLMYWVGRPAVIFGDHGWSLRKVPALDDGAALQPPVVAPTTQPTSQPNDKESKTVEIDESSNGKAVAAKVGGSVVIKLKGNATTGYLWTVKSVDGKSVTAVGDVKYTPAAAAQGVVGSGGVFVATFKAAAAGKAVITMGYTRPWEKNKPPLETFRVTVEVAE
ncbi:MAG: protease inhibitor I42 family protein [Phycisphaerae bacterium]|nr:protease inhibitor I42 family protein [Phycisphaerae bacterium]